jgi:hypothetical protein
MRYTIKAKTGVEDFSIGTQLFTQTPIQLVRCTCIGTHNSEFFDNSKDGKFEVFRDDQLINNPTSAISDVIQFSLNKEDKFLLQVDWLQKQDIDELNEGLAVETIDIGYLSKREAGQIYDRKKAAQLVYSVLLGTVTSEEAFEIEEATEKAQNKLKDGHFKSALKYIEKSVVTGAYTQAVKDEYLLEINAYITALY